MPNTGYQIAGTGENITGIGQDWVNPTFIEADSATASTATVTANSDELRGTDYDTTRLLSTDTIIGVLVVIQWELTAGILGTLIAGTLQLWNASGTLGADFDGAAAVPVDLESDIFAYVGTMPTYTEANGTDFGVQLLVTRVSGSPAIAVRTMKIAYRVANVSTVMQSRRRSNIRSR